MRDLSRPAVPALLVALTGLTYMPAAHAGAPITLTATLGSQKPTPTVALTWTGSTPATQYVIYRDLRTLSRANGGAYNDTGVHSGETHRYFVLELFPKPGTSNTVTVNIPSPAPAAPTNLTATGLWDAAKSAPTAQLAWGTVTGASSYNVYRNGSLLKSGNTTTGFTDAAVISGQAYTYAVSAVGSGGEGAKSAAASVTAPNPPAPPVPTGLAAKGVWDADCVECNNMAMPEVDLSWQATSGATSYKIFRNGTLLQSGLPAPTFEDMTVSSGQTYVYTVAATGPGGDSGQSSPATAIAPNPPPTATGSALTAPTNLAVHGFWQGSPSDVLTWSPVPGAVKYNVYQYDLPIAQGVPGTTYTLPFDQFFNDLTYTVTAVDAMGMESLPSSLANGIGGFDPNNLPPWVVSDGGHTPTVLAATPDWNNGKPRICLSWHGDGSEEVYNIYRDGKLIAGGLWSLTYIDTNVLPDETHTYSVSGVNSYWPGGSEGAQSTPVTSTALTSPPPISVGKVQITKVVPNDDSAVIFFQPLPGAVDYRIYDTSSPTKVKYAGVRTNQTSYPSSSSTSIPLAIEWNGIDPAKGANLVVEAVDKLGPFQKMDGSAGPGTMQMNGDMNMSTNGQGDPSNVPNVLAASDPFHVTCQPRSLIGAQAFFDTFRGSQPFVTSTSIDPVVEANDTNNITQVENDKWFIRNYGGDFDNTKVFVMGNHFMDTLFDGGTARKTNVIHNNNAALIMMPKATADISGGGVLHVTFEVDAHFDGRRWCDLLIADPSDPLINPGKFDPGDPGLHFATQSGNVFRWEIQSEAIGLQVYNQGARQDLVQSTDWNDLQSTARISSDHITPLTNGTTQDLDKRHRFDLYLSQTHYRVVETTPDGTYTLVREKDFPAGVKLPFSKCQVYFVHEVYHTANDRPDMVTYQPWNSYWYNYRPWSDERHWDNMGFEVLSSFPSIGSSPN